MKIIITIWNITKQKIENIIGKTRVKSEVRKKLIWIL